MADSASPKIIFVTGVDGCGKTTLAQYLKDHFVAEGLNTRVIWSRFNNYLSKPLLALTRLTGHNRIGLVGGQAFGFHDFDGLHGYNQLYAALQAVDVNIATWLKYVRALPDSDVIVGERGPWDTLVDVMADTDMDHLYRSALGRLYTRLVRKHSRVLYIDRSLGNILVTRPELVDDHKMERKIRFYAKVAEQENWRIIDNNRTLENAKQALIAAVTE